MTTSKTPTAGQEPGYLVRSEERLAVGIERVAVRRARLEKYIVTETRTITVEVAREAVRLVYDDLDGDFNEDLNTDPSADPATATPGWLLLSEERVIVTKEMVPVERVRLAVSVVTDQQDVSAAVRTEHLELDAGDGSPVRQLS